MTIDGNGMGSSESRNVAQKIQKILNYLVKNPGAMDTDEGIARWWLREDIRGVQPALTLLKNEEILFIKMLSGQQYYLLNERYRHDSQAIRSMAFGDM